MLKKSTMVISSSTVRDIQAGAKGGVDKAAGEEYNVVPAEQPARDEC